MSLNPSDLVSSLCFLRCTNCCFKTYCSQLCLSKDKKHKKFCEVGDLEGIQEMRRDFDRKAKDGRGSRKEAGLKVLEEDLQFRSKLADSLGCPEIAKDFVRAKDLCQK